VVDLTAQLDRTVRLLRQLLRAKAGRKSEQLSRGHICHRSRLSNSGAGTSRTRREKRRSTATHENKHRGRKLLPLHLKGERIEHDLAESDKHCLHCDQDLWRIGEEISERYEYIPAQMKVIVAKCADHLPLHRQMKMFARRGVELSDQTLCGWTAQCAQLLEPLYQRLKRFVLAFKVVGTEDTPVKVLDRKLPQARKGWIWPYVGDRDHLAAVYDYTAMRERSGPEEFLKSYRGHLQADAYTIYDVFFTKPEPGT